MNRIARLAARFLLCSSLLTPALILSSLFTPEAKAVSIELTGSRSVISGTDCDIATYRYRTNTIYNGQALDLLVEVLGEDNEYTNGPSCVGTSSGKLAVRIRDKDSADDVGYVELKVTVVEKDTTTPVEVDRLTVTSFDLDTNAGTAPAGTDDTYFQAPDSVYISEDSEVQYSGGSFFGGQYQAKLKGTDQRDCSDTPDNPENACRASAVFTSGDSGINRVSSVVVRMQNDDAYGQLAPADEPTFFRQFRLSFEIEDFEPTVTDNTDYGDAPSSYGSAGHSVGASIALGYGNIPDHDVAYQASTDADGDDSDATTVDYDDEDGIQLGGQPLDGQSLTAGASTNLNVASFGTGYLSAWIDLDGDGNFTDADEQVVDDLSINSTTVENTTVPIAIPATATAGNSYMRFRFASAQGVGPTGLSSSDGEVEDYRVAIAQSGPVAPSGPTCNINSGLDWNNLSVSSAPSTLNTSQGGVGIQVDFSGDGWSTSSPASGTGGNARSLWDDDDINGSGAGDNAVNRAFSPNGAIYNPNTGANALNTDVTFAQAVANLRFSVADIDFSDFVAVSAVNRSGQTVYPTIYRNSGFTQEWNIYESADAVNPVSGKRTVVGNGTNTNTAASTAYFDFGNEDIVSLSIRTGYLDVDGLYDTPDTDNLGATNTNQSNSFVFFGDILFCVSDHGDAPTSGTAPDGSETNNYGDASHAIPTSPNLYLGSVAPDAELSGQGNTAADGDDTDGTDDEDGVTLPSLTAGQNATVIADVTGAGGYLQGWIDWDGDGSFDTGEQVATDIQDNETGDTDSTAGVISFDVSVPAGAIITADTFARFRWSTTQGLDTTTAASDGEVEDYSVAIASPPISGPTFLCAPDLYIVTGNVERQLYRINRSADPFTFDPIGNPTTSAHYPETFGYNALGFNPQDNYMYGIVEAPFTPPLPSPPFSNTTVVRIDANGDLTSLGIPQPAGGNSNNELSELNDTTPEGASVNTISWPSGAFLLDGTYVVASNINSGAINEIYTIDLSTTPPTATRRGLLPAALADLAVNPQDTTPNRVYAITENTDRLVYFDVTNPAAGITNATPQGTGVNINYGSQFYDNFGNLYFRSASNSNLYRLNADGVAELITAAPTGSNHDGASCPGIDIVKDISTTAPVPAGKNVTYTYQVANSTLNPVTITFADDLRSVSDAIGTADDESAVPVNGVFTSTGDVILANASGTPVLSNSDQTLTIPDLTISPQSIATIEVTVTVPTSASPDTYYNQATISALPLDFPTQILSDYLPGTIFKEPTPLEVTEPVASDPEMLLVKRITAINGDRTTNPNDSTALDQFVDDTTSSRAAEDNNAAWPANYLVGAFDAGMTRPGDEIEYTVYFLNSGDVALPSTVICDRIIGEQTIVLNAYGIGQDIEFQLGTNAVQYFTYASDIADRAEYFADSTTAPTDCSLNAITGGIADNGTWRLALTGTGSSVQSDLSALPSESDAPVDDSYYGYMRFRTRINE
ncbi:MAG: GEVED domain-containing protein [Phormidesmis sp.]